MFKKGLSFVPGSGPRDARLAVVGQGPGEQEAVTGVPFFDRAPSGSILTRWLHSAGIPRATIWIDNVVRCWIPKGFKGGHPFGSTAPPKKAVEFCWRAHVGPALHDLGALEILVPVGAPARAFFLGAGAGERYCGTFNRVDLPGI